MNSLDCSFTLKFSSILSSLCVHACLSGMLGTWNRLIHVNYWKIIFTFAMTQSFHLLFVFYSIESMQLSCSIVIWFYFRASLHLLFLFVWLCRLLKKIFLSHRFSLRSLSTIFSVHFVFAYEFITRNFHLVRFFRSLFPFIFHAIHCLNISFFFCFEQSKK